MSCPQGIVLIISFLVLVAITLYHNYAVFAACFLHCLRCGRPSAPEAPPAAYAHRPPLPRSDSTATLFGDPPEKCHAHKEVELRAKTKTLPRSATLAAPPAPAPPVHAQFPPRGRPLPRSHSLR